MLPRSRRARVLAAVLLLGLAARAGDVQYAHSGAVMLAPFDVGEVAALDVNGDGVLDLLATSFYAEPPQVAMAMLPSLGDGLSFGAAQTVTDGLPSGRMVTGDFDGDGDEDVASALSKTFAWLPNAGGGAFLAKQSKALTQSVSDLACADTDGDGDLDMALAVSNVLSLANDGTGQFSNNHTSLPGSTFKHIVLGDADGDGTPDCVVASASKLQVGLGTGDGTFAAGAILPTAGAKSLALGHFDDDAFLDVGWAAAKLEGSGVRHGLGDGGFGEAQAIAGPAGAELERIAAADLDGDGDDDLALSGKHTEDFLYFAEAENGALNIAPAGRVRVQSGPRCLALCDVDGDGLVDVLTGHLSFVLGLVRGSGLHTFTQSSVGLVPGLAAFSEWHAEGDFTADGCEDLLLRTTTGAVLLQGSASGGFAEALTPISFAPGWTWWGLLAAGDFTGDGELDAVAIVNAPSGASGLQTLGGDGSGTLAPGPFSPLPGPLPKQGAPADLDLDGDLDVIGAAWSGEFAKGLNLGTGRFVVTVEPPTAQQFEQLLAGDLDGDGLPEVVSSVSGGFDLRMNLGSGVMSAAQFVPQGSAGRGLGDLDGDGRLEILQAKPVQGAPPVLHAITLQDGGFSTVTALDFGFINGQWPLVVGVADLNGDGLADVLARSNCRMSALLSTGPGSLQDEGLAFIDAEGFAGEHVEVFMLDANGDGLADVATLRSGSVTLSRCAAVGRPGPWQDLGFALPGSAGAPSLAGTGDLVGGTPAGIHLANASALSPAAVVVGANALVEPWKGGTLVPSPDVVAVLATGAAGELHVEMDWPAGLPGGFDLYVQVWIVDAGGPKGFAASNALRAVTP